MISRMMLIAVWKLRTGRKIAANSVSNTAFGRASHGAKQTELPIFCPASGAVVLKHLAISPTSNPHMTRFASHV
jgi:hypothetical protein